jgi:transcriptional regulator GlxA family with amidase domain
MRIGFVVYDGMTLLDFAGVYDPVTRLKTMGFMQNLSYEICAKKAEIQTSEGVTLKTDRIRADLSTYNYLIIPGGDGIRKLLSDREFLNWISVAPNKTCLAAVCGGVLLVGATGILKGRRATTHPEFKKFLKNMGAEVLDDRIVEDDNVITAGGVTASIDLGLYLCERIAGSDIRQKIQRQMDYLNFTVK